ncbi:MAG: hypothetical protein OJF49_000154 [Ktedonobacterales bacterium]|jgi:protein SCO1/2|nr:MAG: hypothetical protein OJF49_000154 [Ktedonobacterales bacterium]
MRLRLLSRITVISLVVIVAAIMIIHSATTSASKPAPKLDGIDLGSAPAPAFSLVDQSGATISLDQLQGHPVVVTFLYTHCPDACPLTAEKLHAAAQSLGPKASKVSWVIISIDPVGDTPTAASQFLAAHHLDGEAHYLLGTQAQLQPIWDAYHIAVSPNSDDGQAQVSGISHSVGVYILDAQGRERIFLDAEFAPSTLASDLRALTTS